MTLHPSDDCAWVATGQRIVMVPTAIVSSREPFRPAGPGEAQVPAWLEDTICTVHEETSFAWRAIDPDSLEAVASAIAAGCDAGCHCRCHPPRRW